MAHRIENNQLVIDGWEKGIAPSPYTGIANIRNLDTQYYPGVAYVNYRRQAATLNTAGITEWYAGSHSTNVSGNNGWLFESNPGGMSNPVQHATSPQGINYILDASGQVWKQSSVNSSTFDLLRGTGRYGIGASGIAYWNNYIVVIGNGFIEICGDGSGDSGITGSNWNIYSGSGSQTGDLSLVDYTSLTAAQFTLSVYSPLRIYQNEPIQFSSTGSLPTGLSTSTNYYVWQPSSFAGAGYFAVSTSLNYLNNISLFSTPSSGATSATLASNWAGTTGTYEMIFKNSSGYESRAVTLTNGANTITWSTGLVNNVSSLSVPVCVNITSNGSGTISITSQAPILPIGNCTDFTFSEPVVGNTTISITSYVSPSGTTVNGVWLQPTGTYNIVDPLGNNILAIFTFGSTSCNLLSPLTTPFTTGSYSINILSSDSSVYRMLVSKVDGNLYFTNGYSMGSLTIAEANSSFNPGNIASFTVSYSTFALSTAANAKYETITDMVDLQNSMIVGGENNIYVWDYVSAYTEAPVPIGEPIHRLINLLNMIYVFAGEKGNIYTSNGSYAQMLIKIPDYISGAIDPQWSFGGVMTHRGRIYFQATAKDTSGNYLLTGIFYIIVSPSILGEIAQGIGMDAQNSNGLIPPSGFSTNGILISNEPSSSGQDSYYSVFSNGSNSGLIDYNDTTLWQNEEPAIETDLIPLGSYLNKKTLGQVQFTLDRPLATGDSISLYARPSLSDSWTSMGSWTATQSPGGTWPSNISQSIWVQFKITFSCASSGSSRIPLKEIRMEIQ